MKKNPELAAYMNCSAEEGLDLDRFVEHGSRLLTAAETASLTDGLDTLQAKIATLKVDNGRFRQMWRLIFMEEITHLSQGDTIQISAKVKSSSGGHQQVVMYVRDTGVWESKDKPANLFDPFYTRSRKPDDFGVNMMACYVTLHLHGGSVTARRLEPGGMEMIMRLPLDPHKNTQEAEDFLRRSMNQDREWGQPRELAA